MGTVLTCGSDTRAVVEAPVHDCDQLTGLFNGLFIEHSNTELVRGDDEPIYLPADRSLVAVNSINWARIMAQIVYYFYAAVAVGSPARPVAFSVPTGNFGDIFAGYLAQKMGLPIDRLIIATNHNDVLHRVLTRGRYERAPLQPSLSPSMDIPISSNFERLLFDLYDRDGAAIADLMSRFDQGEIAFSDTAMARARTLFQQVCNIIAGKCGK